MSQQSLNSCLKIRKPSAVVLDLLCVTKANFAEQVLLPYAKQNVASYLEANWSDSEVQNDVQSLREVSLKQDSLKKIDGTSASAETIRKSVVEYVNGALDAGVNNEALATFILNVLADGYSHDRLKTAVFADVAITARTWAMDERVPLYIMSDDSRAAKLFLARTNLGDMSPLISGHFDSRDGSFTESSTYERMVENLKMKPEDVLILSHSGAAGSVAKSCGFSVVLLLQHRRDLSRMTNDEKRALPHVRSLHKLIFADDAPKASTLDGSAMPE